MPVIRAYNPYKRKRKPVRRAVRHRGAATRAKKVSRNPGADKLVVFMPNPHHRKARNASRRRNRTVVHAKRRRNPIRALSTHRRHHSRRRNPLAYKSAVVDAIWASGGAVGTRALTQVALGSKNQGAMGYVANGAVAVGLGMLAEKFSGAQSGNMVLVGGLVATLLRIVQEKLMPAGAISTQLSLQGLGDASFAFGDFVKSFAVLPSSSVADASGNMVNNWQPFYNAAVSPYLPPPPTAAASHHSLAGYDFATGEPVVDRYKSRFG